jgi:hypothetical protein
MLAQVQADLGTTYSLAARRQAYIWNGPLGTMLNVSDDPFVYEFEFNEFQHPLTYLGDEVATIFLVNGFTVWFRAYGGMFRLLAVPLTPGVLGSPWANYVTGYWDPAARPVDDRIYPVMHKLPCRWMVEAGYASQENLERTFPLDWHIPDYLSAGRQYLAYDCAEANRISQEVIGYWDVSSMCGPLTWRILKDVDGFPYRIGSWYATDFAFTGANPRWSGQPWSSFDPDTFDLIRTETPMPGYDFARRGDLFPGDIVYSFTTMYYIPGDPRFDHIFLVAALAQDGGRLAVTNMIGLGDCAISEVTLYTPGNRTAGTINHEWNNGGYGLTGTTGFDIFRWNWVSYHINGVASEYTVRWGDTLETIVFDWKVDPQALLQVNGFAPDVQLLPGQVIQLPVPEAFAPVPSMQEASLAGS